MEIKISEIYVGYMFTSPKNGKGMITAKTQRTLTVTFENGNTVKNTYKNSDCVFLSWEF